MGKQDTTFSLLSPQKLNKEFMSFIPNILLIFSIGITIILILCSIGRCDPEPYSMFYFASSPIKTSTSTLSGCDRTQRVPQDSVIELTDASLLSLIGYVVTNAYFTTFNASSFLIRRLYDVLDKDSTCCYGVVSLYILFYIIVKFSKEVIDAFVPFDFFKIFAHKKNKSSLLFDIIFSVLAVISILFILCLLLSIIVYFAFLFKGLFDMTNEFRVKLIPIYFMFIVTIPIIAWAFKLNIQIFEGPSKKKVPAKLGNYNWIIFLLIALGIPFISTIQTIGSLIAIGLAGILSKDAGVRHKIRCIGVYGCIMLLVLFILKIVMHILGQSANILRIHMLTQLIRKIHILF